MVHDDPSGSPAAILGILKNLMQVVHLSLPSLYPVC